MVAVLLINFVFGALTQVINIGITAIRQAVTPDEFQGRVAATLRFSALGLTPLGSLAGGYLGQALGLRVGLLFTTLAMCLAPVCMILSPLRRLGKELPAPGSPRPAH